MAMRDALAYSLSESDIYKLNPRTKILLYEDVKRHGSVEHLLHPYGSCVILYEWDRTANSSSGHWIAVNQVPVSRDPKDGWTIEHFDSYAIKPDKELDQLRDAPQAFRKMTGQDNKYLLKLYRKCRIPISYNNYRLQSLSENVSTCGRFCAIRTLQRDRPLDDFAAMFQGKRETPDEIAVRLTEGKF